MSAGTLYWIPDSTGKNLALFLGPHNAIYTNTLTVYRYLRQQLETRGLSDVELGPDEWKLYLNSEQPKTLSSSQQKKFEEPTSKKQVAELDTFKL